MKLRPTHIALMVFVAAVLLAGACAHMPDTDLYCRRKAVASVKHITDLPLDWLWRVQYWTANQYNIELARQLEPDYHRVIRLEVDIHIVGPAALARMAKRAGATPEAVGLYHCPGGRIIAPRWVTPDLCQDCLEKAGQKQRAQERAERRLDLLKHSNLSPEALDWSFDRADAEAKGLKAGQADLKSWQRAHLACRYWPGGRQGLYLYGDAGTGKTVLAWCLLTWALTKTEPLTCFFLAVSELFDEVGVGFGGEPFSPGDFGRADRAFVSLVRVAGGPQLAHIHAPARGDLSLANGGRSSGGRTGLLPGVLHRPSGSGPHVGV